MNPIFDSVPPQDALELEQVARLIYESRENRRKVLSAVGASDEAELLARIASEGFAVGNRRISLGALDGLWTAWRAARQH